MDIRTPSIMLAMAMFANANASLVHSVSIRDDLENSCTNCIRRGCTVISNAPFEPDIYARHIELLDAEFAIGLAVSFSRFNLADDVKFSNVVTKPLPIEDVVEHPMPFEVNGVCLTNMSARVFAFYASPTSSTRKLPCTLVSFFKDSEFSESSYLYSLYVNDATGETGLSVQDCSGGMHFLLNTWRYPFLNPVECEKQQEFVERFHRRKYAYLGWR